MPFDATEYTVDPLLITEPRARLMYLRDFLRALPPERFDIADWFSRDGKGSLPSDRAAQELTEPCGTAACIAGWTVAIFAPRHRGSPGGEAARLLGLEDDCLFFPPSHKLLAYQPAQAADVIDHLLATGEVDWSAAQPRVVPRPQPPSASDPG